jgi:hypothetical protein
MTDLEKELADSLRTLLADYRTEGCPDPKCGICAKSKAAQDKAWNALDKTS